MTISMKSCALKKLLAAIKTNKTVCKKQDESKTHEKQETVKQPLVTSNTERTKDLALTLEQANLISQQNLIKLNNNKSKDDTPVVEAQKHITEAEALSQGYTLIKTSEDLEKITKNPSGKFMLMNDIEYKNLSGVTFSGELNGNNFSISNAFSTLFKTIDNASIKNLEFINSSHDENHTPKYDAILAETAKNSTIENCKIDTGMNGNSTRLITDIYDTKVKNCSVDNKNTEIGQGLIGRAINSNIENCSFKGLISKSGGAIVDLANKSTISNCTSSGEFKNCSYAGGIIGSSLGAKISDCSSSMNISGKIDNYSSETEIGGIVGIVRTNTEIENCNYNGAITGVSDLGGIVGKCENADLKINNCNVSGTIEGKRNLAGFIGLSNPSKDNKIRVTNSSMSSVIKSKDLGGKGVCEIAGGFINKYVKGDVKVENCTMTGSIEGPCGYAMDNFGFRNGDKQMFDGFDRFGFGYMAGVASKDINNDGTPVFVNCTINPQNSINTKPNTPEIKPTEKVYPKYTSVEEGYKASQDLFDNIDTNRKETLSKLADGYGEGDHSVYSYVFEVDGKLYEAQREILASHAKNSNYFPTSYQSRGNFVTEYPAPDGLDSYRKELVEKAYDLWKQNPNTNPIPFTGTSCLENAEYFLKYLADKGELGTQFPIDLPVTLGYYNSLTNKGEQIFLRQGFTVHIEKYTDESGVEVFYTNYPDAFMSKNTYHVDDSGNEYIKGENGRFTLKSEIQQQKIEEKVQIKSKFNSMLSNSAYIQTKRIKSHFFDDKLF